MEDKLKELIDNQMDIVEKLQLNNSNLKNIQEATETLDMLVSCLLELQIQDSGDLFSGITANTPFVDIFEVNDVFATEESIDSGFIGDDKNTKEISYESEHKAISDTLDHSLKWYKRMSDALKKKLSEDAEFIRTSTEKEYKEYMSKLLDK